MDSDINTLLQRWNDTKEKIKEYEMKCEKYKKIAEKLMEKSGATHLTGDVYKVERRDISKSSIAKKNVPSDIWEKYATTASYSAFYLKKK